jgi:Flp pilus assembly protein TadG
MSSSACERMLCARKRRGTGDLDSQSRYPSNRKKLRSRQGASAVEFAFVAPVFFVLVFGLIELGRMVMVQQALTNAAREGCRTATLATTINESEVETAVRNYLKSVMRNASNASEVRVTVPNGLASTAAGTDLTVAVEANYADVSWMPLRYLGLNPKIAAKQIGKRE